MTSVTTPQARVEVFGRFQAQWPTLHSDVPMTFEGEKFDPDAHAEYVRVTVRHLARTQETLGGVGERRFSSDISIFVQVFTEPGKGLARLDALMQSARGVFEGTSFNGVRCFAGETTEQGEEGKWIAGLVEVPADYEETK